MKRLIYFLFAILGFAAAATSCAPDMYGVPYTEYRDMERTEDGNDVEEKMAEEADNNPIKEE